MEVAFSEYNVKFTPFPSQLEPSGNGFPGRYVSSMYIGF